MLLVLHLLLLLHHVLLRSVLDRVVKLFHRMAPTKEALGQREIAREAEIRRDLPEERQQASCIWLRGKITEAWQLNHEQGPGVAACHPRGPSHLESVGTQAHDCIYPLDESGEAASSTVGDQQVEEPCVSISPKHVSENSSPVRLNRFERPSRNAEEDMHLLSLRRHLQCQKTGELKFRTDFDACFKDFPLENLYVPHWTCRTPVSAQASIRNFREPSATRSDNEKPLGGSCRHDDDIVGCSVYEYARLHGLMDDVILPRNSDGTYMAELDAAPPIEHHSSMDSTLTPRSSEISSALVATTSIVSVPESNRLAKRFTTLRPIWWARKASLLIKHKRDSGKHQRLPMPDSLPTAIKQNDAPVGSWTIEATEGGLLYYHSALTKRNERPVPSLTNSATSTIEMAEDKSFPLVCVVDNDEYHDGNSENGSDHGARVEEVIVGGCYISVACEEQ